MDRSLADHRFVGALSLAFLLLGPAPHAAGDVTFYLHRHGSPQDSAYDAFGAAAGDVRTEDFEDADRFVQGQPVDALAWEDGAVNLAGDWNGPYVPVVFFSTAFNVPDRVFSNALLVGFGLTVTPAEGTAVRAAGLWIFDDQRSLDSAYLVEVVETNGAAWTAVLENEIPPDGQGHEIEGFAGAVSDVGIASFRVRSVDPATQAPQGDLFEVDHLVVSLSAGVPEEPADGGGPSYQDAEPGEGIGQPIKLPRAARRAQWLRRYHERVEAWREAREARRKVMQKRWAERRARRTDRRND